MQYYFLGGKVELITTKTSDADETVKRAKKFAENVYVTVQSYLSENKEVTARRAFRMYDHVTGCKNVVINKILQCLDKNEEKEIKKEKLNLIEEGGIFYGIKSEKA